MIYEKDSGVFIQLSIEEALKLINELSGAISVARRIKFYTFSGGAVHYDRENNKHYPSKIAFHVEDD